MGSPGLFAAYVQKDAPEGDEVVAVAEALRVVLRREMVRRGVWGRPPSAWGYAGKSWRDEETLNDLLYDCFAFVFTGSRRDRLRDYARAGQPVDPVVRRAVRNFLNEQEEKKDPVGHAVFKNVQAAAAEAVEAGRLATAGGADGITSLTVVAAPGRPGPPADPDEVRRLLADWADGGALCRRIARRGPAGALAATLALDRLAAAAGTWQLGDLVEAVKGALPARKAGSLEDEVLRVLPSGDSDSSPTRRVEEEDRVRARAERTRAAIASLDAQAKVRERLGKLWEWMLGEYQANEEFPRQSDAVAAFGRDRKRVSDDYGRLRPLLQEIWGLDPDD